MYCIQIDELKRAHIAAIVEWNDGRDEDFLRQWSGRGYAYPLTEVQIVQRQAEGGEVFVFLLGEEMIGTIELMRRREDGSGHIGRFLLDPSRTGKGLGTAAMKAFLTYAKEKLELTAITLSVFDFNIGAYRCYQKCGFAEIERLERPNGWVAIEMKKEL